MEVEQTFTNRVAALTSNSSPALGAKEEAELMKTLDKVIALGIAQIEIFDVDRDAYFQQLVNQSTLPNPQQEYLLEQYLINWKHASRKVVDLFSSGNQRESVQRLRRELEDRESQYPDDCPFTFEQRAKIPTVGLASGISREIIDVGYQQMLDGNTMSLSEMFKRARQAQDS